MNLCNTVARKNVCNSGSRLIINAQLVIACQNLFRLFKQVAPVRSVFQHFVAYIADPCSHAKVDSKFRHRVQITNERVPTATTKFAHHVSYVSMTTNENESRVWLNLKSCNKPVATGGWACFWGGCGGVWWWWGASSPAKQRISEVNANKPIN